MITYTEMQIRTINDRKRWEFNQRFYAKLQRESVMKVLEQTESSPIKLGEDI